MNICCKQMEYHLNEFFYTPEDVDNPDVIIKYFKSSKVFGIPIYDGGSSIIKINFGPWCGKKLTPKTTVKAMQV